MLGRRTCPWLSGTTPAFAAVFRSNSHTQLNHRLPLLPETHDDELCSKRCHKECGNIKVICKLAQRAQREATGYYCGYTFKGQAIGRTYLLKASQSLDYLTDALENKTAAQRMHHITNKCFSDMFHRCCSRPTTEEWNFTCSLGYDVGHWGQAP